MRYILTGVETNNKGAELMLYAILQQIEIHDPDAEVFLRMDAVRQGLDYINTKIKLCEKPYKKQVMYARRWKIVSILSRIGINTNYLFSDARIVNNVDYLIDGSGFWFSDQWNLEDGEINMWSIMLENYRKQGTHIVFLPQAFGPIELRNTKKVIACIAKNADIIMPREEVSFNYLSKAGVQSSKMYMFPDFTSLVNGITPQRLDHLKDGICIIPNMRMIDKGIITLDGYMSIIKIIIFQSKKSGRPVYLLNHEGQSDEKLLILAKELLGNKIVIVDGLNALEVKGLISTSYLCISSRFHGVASALNSCVPCLATSWSHKYELLFHDYNQENCVLDLNNIQLVQERIDQLLSEDYNKKIRCSLFKQVPIMKKKSEEMWDLIWDLKK